MWLLLVVAVGLVAWILSRTKTVKNEEYATQCFEETVERPVRLKKDHWRWPMTPDKNGFIYLPNGDSFLTHSFAPAGDYLLGVRDGQAGGRKDGVAVLVASAGLVWKKKLTRPMYAAVADDGTCVVGDIQGNQLKSRLYIWAVDGTVLLSQEISANFWNVGISPDGSVAVCQTCNNRSHDDGNSLFVFDTRSGDLLSRSSTRTGWPNGYRFDTEQRSVTLTYKDGSEWHYGFDGAFQDAEALAALLPAPAKRRTQKAKNAAE